MKRLFVTGTDTGVGKTYVTAALAHRARQQGKRVLAFKPIETGCKLVGVRLVGADQEELCEAAGDWQTGLLRGVYQLVQPLAPLIAASAEGTSIDLEQVVSVCNGVRDIDLALVEGAGGWRVPITETEDMASLARRLECPVLLVARAAVGTINHTLLTIEAIERDGCTLEAVVVSRRSEDDLAIAQSNCVEIGRRWPERVLLFDTDPSVLDPLL